MFISDLHLQPELKKTVQGLDRFLQHHTADAVFLLGDVFEVWVGDDSAHSGFAAQGIELLRAAASRKPLYFMAGNRDFLLSEALLTSLGITKLADPTTFEFGNERFLLSHGDLYCTDDAPYQQFRQMVRNPQWQMDFLHRPLSERLAIAQNMREQSQDFQKNKPSWIDLNQEVVAKALQETGTATLIHGHTHAPQRHDLGRNAAGQTLTREVLSDWDLDASQPRAEVFQLSLAPGGTQVMRSRYWPEN